eukprot:scaffold132867_cov17-Prasinocladus_malaysianus.AAC.1
MELLSLRMTVSNRAEISSSVILATCPAIRGGQWAGLTGSGTHHRLYVASDQKMPMSDGMRQIMT